MQAIMLFTFTIGSCLLSSVSALDNAFEKRSGYTAPQWLSTWRNQSLLFGYQLVGAQVAEPEDVCNNMTILDHQRWAGMGLDTYAMQRPFCDQIGADSEDWSTTSNRIASNMKFFNTGTFLTQLLYSFDLSNATATFHNPFVYLCNSLRPNLLEAFEIQSDRFLPAICAASNLTITPPPFFNGTNVTQASQEALNTHQRLRSTFFAYLMIASNTNGPEADALCHTLTDRKPSLSNEGFDSEVVSQTACGIDGRRLSGWEAGTAIRLWFSRVYVHILRHASDAPDWLPWLCENLDAGAMNVTGLYGKTIEKGICARADGCRSGCLTDDVEAENFGIPSIQGELMDNQA